MNAENNNMNGQRAHSEISLNKSKYRRIYGTIKCKVRVMMENIIENFGRRITKNELKIVCKIAAL